MLARIKGASMARFLLQVANGGQIRVSLCSRASRFARRFRAPLLAGLTRSLLHNVVFSSTLATADLVGTVRRRSMLEKVTGLLLVMLLAVHASAEETFPGAIQQAAGIQCAPTCLLCHTEIPGNIGNLKQPFGLAVLRSGVRPGEPSS